MIVRADFGNVFRGDVEAGMTDFWIILEAEDEAFELGGGFLGFGKFVKIDFQRCRSFGIGAVRQPEGVLDELIVEAEVSALNLILGKTGGNVGVLPEHDAYPEMVGSDLVKEGAHERLVFGQIGCGDLGPLDLAEEVE